MRDNTASPASHTTVALTAPEVSVQNSCSTAIAYFARHHACRTHRYTTLGNKQWTMPWHVPSGVPFRTVHCTQTSKTHSQVGKEQGLTIQHSTKGWQRNTDCEWPHRLDHAMKCKAWGRHNVLGPLVCVRPFEVVLCSNNSKQKIEQLLRAYPHTASTSCTTGANTHVTGQLSGCCGSPRVQGSRAKVPQFFVRLGSRTREILPGLHTPNERILLL